MDPALRSKQREQLLRREKTLIQRRVLCHSVNVRLPRFYAAYEPNLERPIPTAVLYSFSFPTVKTCIGVLRFAHCSMWARVLSLESYAAGVLFSDFEYKTQERKRPGLASAAPMHLSLNAQRPHWVSSGFSILAVHIENCASDMGLSRCR